MSYQPVITDNGLEIRDSNGNVIWGPSETYNYPPDQDMMKAVFDDASISEPTKSVLSLLVGGPDIKDERTETDQS